MSRRALSLILGVSVALNLFLLGMGASRLLREDRVGRPGVHHQSHRANGERRGRGASGRKQRWLSEEQREAAKRGRAALRESRNLAREALRREPFDAEALRARLAGLRESARAMQESMHEALVQRAGQLSVEERRALADRHFKRSKRGRRRR